MCSTDVDIADAGGNAVSFSRDQTLMQGGSCCTFRYKLRRDRRPVDPKKGTGRCDTPGLKMLERRLAIAERSGYLSEVLIVPKLVLS